ncbi:hypothetical protein [Alcanivorax jadensis]|uniref:hypothetical protein n=1 Tax=Alcanivorax jadensis TaxID=64988 RepID=UPI002356EE84|nr:hypothetical protein [Alcanivorax jadensis]|tara:strand:- start:747 stop:1148 length:402 start_codon:yes stop_codon:yes gene_type:complete
MIRLTLSEPTPLLNVWQRWHWQQRRRYTQHVRLELRSQIIPPKEPLARCHIEIKRYSIGLPDWDGLFASAKAPLDCLVVQTKQNPHGLGIIEDDNPKCVLTLTVKPVQVKHKAEQRTEIIVTPANDNEVSEYE